MRRLVCAFCVLVVDCGWFCQTHFYQQCPVAYVFFVARAAVAFWFGAPGACFLPCIGGTTASGAAVSSDRDQWVELAQLAVHGDCNMVQVLVSLRVAGFGEFSKQVLAASHIYQKSPRPTVLCCDRNQVGLQVIGSLLF